MILHSDAGFQIWFTLPQPLSRCTVSELTVGDGMRLVFWVLAAAGVISLGDQVGAKPAQLTTSSAIHVLHESNVAVQPEFAEAR